MLHDGLTFIIGIVVGVMNAIAGGGMLIGFPALLAMGIAPLSANATTALVVIPGQISAAFGYRTYFKNVPRRYLLLLIPLVAGAALGASLLRHTPPSRFADLSPVLILFAVSLFICQPFLYKYIHSHLHGPKNYRQKLSPLLISALALLPIAIYGSYFGAGFGFIMLAFLSFTTNTKIHRMNALKSIAGIAVAGTSVVFLSNSGLINWHYGLVMATGNVIGGYSGARLSQKVSSHLIRVVVIIIGVTAALLLAIHTY
jgi:uncharacterized membrane protein YfcA